MLENSYYICFSKLIFKVEKNLVKARIVLQTFGDSAKKDLTHYEHYFSLFSRLKIRYLQTYVVTVLEHCSAYLKLVRSLEKFIALLKRYSISDKKF